jgi:hypothetical protein
MDCNPPRSGKLKTQEEEMQFLRILAKKSKGAEKVFGFKWESPILIKESSGYTMKKERLNPLNDYLFAQYMGTEECKECLISFLNAVLKEEITDLEILKNLDLPRESPEGKYGRLDVRAKLSEGTQINVQAKINFKIFIR